MKKQDAQSIGEIIDRVLKEQNLDLKLDETRLIKAWNSLLGEQVASYTTNFIFNGVFCMYISHLPYYAANSVCAGIC